MRKKIIVHVITGLNTGGAEIMLYKLLSAMQSGEFESVVISLTNDGPVGKRIANIGIPVHSLGMQPGRPSLSALHRLRSSLKNIRPDLIQGWMYHGNLACSIAQMLSWGRTPVLWSIRQSLDHLQTEKRSTAAVIHLGARLSRLPQGIVYNSRHSMAQHTEIGYCGKRAVVIPNGFDCEMFRPNYDSREKYRHNNGLDGNDILIGMIGRFHPMKDHENFLRAAGLLCRRYKRVWFLLAGQGLDRDNAELEKMLLENNINDRVKLLGERDDIPELTACLDIATLSSTSEAFPNVIGEAMACGVPCVTTAVGDAEWILAGTGKVVPVRDPEALASGWGEYIDAGMEQRRRAGEKARRRIVEYFSLEKVVCLYGELYDSVLCGGIKGVPPE